jgi:hypothetical protein
MSTVVALGHFCEVHGPRLVFYTIRNVHEPQFVSQCPDLKFCSGCKAPLLEGYISTVQTVHANSTSSPLAKSGSAPTTTHQSGSGSSSKGHHHPTTNGHCSTTVVASSSNNNKGLLKVSASSQTLSRGIYAPIPSQLTNGVGSGDSGESSNSDIIRVGTSRGTAPSSRPNNHHPATTTTTSTTTKYYCSHSNYDHSHLSHLHTCIARTLSCEVTPSNSVAFTSTDIWVIGTSFSLKDSQARGFHRKYCLVFTFLPEVPNCCQPEDSPPQVVQQKKKGNKSGKDESGHHHHLKTCPKYKGDRRPPSRSHAQSVRDEYYSDGDHKAYFSSSYGSQGYPSLVPYYDYITEEFYNVAKHLQGECDKVYYKEQSISPQRALRLSAVFDTSEGSAAGAGGSSSLGGYGRSGGPKVFTRSHSSGARSLPLLSENPHIFLDLHEKFAKILHHVDL